MPRPARRSSRPRPGGRVVVLLAAAATSVAVLGSVLTVQSTNRDAGGGAAVASADRSGHAATVRLERVPVVSVPADAGTGPVAAPAPTPVPAPVPPAHAPVSTQDAPAPGPPAAGTAPRTSQAAQPCDVGTAVGQAQVVVVRSSGTRATVRACARTSDGSYTTELGPFSGYVGRSGVTPASSKREGDGATPAGVFPLRSGFGTKGDPGLAQGWKVVDGADVWVDDPASALYNTPQREPADGRWASAEKLANPPAYTYVQVIGYNESARPAAGSAIFLHVSTGNPTLGCVSLPTAELLEVMRWQRPGAVIAIS